MSNLFLLFMLCVGALAAQNPDDYLQRAKRLQCEARALDDQIYRLPIGDPQRQALRKQQFKLLDASSDAAADGINAVLSDPRVEFAVRGMEAVNTEIRTAIIYRHQTRWRRRFTFGLWQ